MRRNLTSFILLSILCIFCISAQAQSGSVYLTGGFHTVKSKSFSTFSGNYNRMHDGALSETIDPEMVGLGLGIGGNYAMESGLLFGAEFSTSQGKSQATFADSSVRTFTFRQDVVTLYTGFTPDTYDQIFYIYPVIGFTVGRNRMETSFVPGQTLLSDGLSNNTYNTFAGKFLAGIHFAFGKSNVKTLIRFNYSFPLGGGTMKADDNSKFVTDPISLSANPNSYKGGYQRGDLRGLCISGGIAVNFGL